MKKLILLLMLAGAAIAQVPYTTITDTLPAGSSGKAVNGSINVTWTTFTYGAATIAQSPTNGYNYPIVNGVVSFALAPTDHAAASVTYKVVATIGGQAVTTFWSVPTLPSGQCASSGHCTIKEVTVAFPAGASFVVNPGAISTGSSTNGQTLCNVSGITGWCAPGGGGTWGGIGGTLSDQTDLQTALNARELTARKDQANGYAGLDSTGKVPASELPPPTNSVLGGVQASSMVTHQWVDSISTSGVPHLSQPATGDISGLGTAATHASTDFQSALGYTAENVANKDGNSGYAGLDASSKLKVAEFPLPYSAQSIVYPCNSSSGSGTAYTCTTGAAVTLADGMLFAWLPDVNCSTPNPSLNVDGTGAKTVYTSGGNSVLQYCQFSAGFGPLLVRYKSSLSAMLVVGSPTFTPENASNKDATNGYAGLSGGKLAAGELPNPGASTLGGVESIASASHQWVDSISTAGVPHQSQPASSDLTDSAHVVKDNANSLQIVYPCNSSSASTTAYTCPTGSSVVLADGMLFAWTPDLSCGSSPTLNIDGTGALTVYGALGSQPGQYCQILGGVLKTSAVLLRYSALLNGYVVVNAVDYTNASNLTHGAVSPTVLSGVTLGQFCGVTSTCAATPLVFSQMIMGSAPLVSGTPSTVTITGISPAFSGSTSYRCTVTAQSGAGTALFSVANVSGSSFTITGPASVTTVVNYVCAGG
jgi:hypothetical protein